MTSGLELEGTLTFFVKHRNPEWSVDADTYRFPAVRRDPIAVSAVKHADGSIDVVLSGPFGGEYSFNHPIPPCDQRGLQIGLTWVHNRVMLYLNGELCQTRRAFQVVH